MISAPGEPDKPAALDGARGNVPHGVTVVRRGLSDHSLFTGRPPVSLKHLSRWWIKVALARSVLGRRHYADSGEGERDERNTGR